MTTASVTSPTAPVGFDVAAWVAVSCARQGVPVKVTDARVVARVAVLLSGRRSVSEPPDGLDPGGIEPPGALDTGSDHGMVEHRGDDGVAAVQSQSGPLVP